MNRLLDVRNLNISFDTEIGRVEAVKDISFHVNRGEILAMVGDSGSGKSVCALSVTGLLKHAGAEKHGGTVIFEGRELDYNDEEALRKIRGGGIAYIFQEPLSSLNPLENIEKQITERLVAVKKWNTGDAKRRALELLELVGIRNSETRLKDLPHTFSGGERQRIMIAAALADNPRLLIADEPTTALDVTVQKQILELISGLKNKLDMSIILITHNFEIVRRYADRIVVVNDGNTVEEGNSSRVSACSAPVVAYEPPAAPAPVSCAEGEVFLKVSGLSVVYTGRSSRFGGKTAFRAVDNVSLELKKGRNLGIVGESASGKTSLVNAILRLIPSVGDVFFMGQCISAMKPGPLRKIRRYVQAVFQDPYCSINPRMTIGAIVAEGLKAHVVKDGNELKDAVKKTLVSVGLPPDITNRYPHEFSGGQRQRIAIARAVILKPELVIFDEPTSSLDRRVQLQVVELLKNLQIAHDMSYIFVSHDLNLVRSICHEIAVMKEGAIVESGATGKIIHAPEHKYTKTLIRAAFF